MPAKAFAIALTAFLTSASPGVSFAEVPTEPPMPCSAPGRCSLAQEAIAQDFLAGSNISKVVGIYSGECFVAGGGYQNDHAHHGVALIDQIGDQWHYSGEFGFFYKENPYRHLSVAQAREKFPDIQDASRRLSLTEKFAFIDFHPEGDPIWQYFFRASPDRSQLLLIGLWDKTHIVLCRMSAH